MKESSFHTECGDDVRDGIHSVTVQIAGQKYTIRTDADEQYVAKLAKYVDQKIEEAKRVTRTVSTHQIVILAALTMADEVFRAQKETALLKSRIRERARAILQYLDEEVHASEEKAQHEKEQTLVSSPAKWGDGVEVERSTTQKRTRSSPW